MRLSVSFVAALAAITVPASGAFAASAVQKECSAKYQAAKAGNTLNGLNYRQFYSQCSAQAKAEKAGGTTPTTVAPSAPTPTAAPAPVAPAPAPTIARAPTTAAPVATGSAVFPSAVSAQYKALTAGKARFKTCDDQYRINKTNNGNGGLKWIEKGGGYYSECNKRLKG